MVKHYGSKMPKETVTRGEKMENVSFFLLISG